MKALVVLGGREIAFKEKALKADLVICADSGADYAKNQGIVPDVIIGDMDSVSEEALAFFQRKKTEIIKLPVEKNSTDGEIAVEFAKEKNADEMDIVCAEGSIDHYLGNLGLLIYAKELGIEAWLETSDMTACAVRGEIKLKGERGTRVSVMPADGDVVILERHGLYYELLEPTRIKSGQTLGLGNHMTGDECTIEVLEGTAFVFVEKR